jgi:hypothetical protein
VNHLNLSALRILFKFLGRIYLAFSSHFPMISNKLIVIEQQVVCASSLMKKYYSSSKVFGFIRDFSRKLEPLLSKRKQSSERGAHCTALGLASRRPCTFEMEASNVTLRMVHRVHITSGNAAEKLKFLQEKTRH